MFLLFLVLADPNKKHLLLYQKVQYSEKKLSTVRNKTNSGVELKLPNTQPLSPVMHLQLISDMSTVLGCCGRNPRVKSAAYIYEHCVVTVADNLQTHSSEWWASAFNNSLGFIKMPSMVFQ